MKKEKKEKLYNLIALSSLRLMIAMIMFPRYLMNPGQGMLGAAPVMTLTSSGVQTRRAGVRGARGRRIPQRVYTFTLSPRLAECDPAMVLQCLHSARCHPQLITLGLN